MPNIPALLPSLKRPPSVLKKLEKALVYGEVELLIPKLFLTGKWKKLLGETDLLLRLDNDLLVQVGQEGAALEPVRHLRRREAQALLNKARKATKEYAKLLNTFQKFLEKWADEPAKERKYGERPQEEEAQGAQKLRKKEEKESPDAGQEEEHDRVEEFSGEGGESPYPTLQ